MKNKTKKIEFEESWNQLVIDPTAIKSNYRYLRSRLQECRLYAVLKSDAYGHGINGVATALMEAGCTHFAVYSPQEGIQIRKQGFDGEILLLNPIPEWMAEMVVFHDLSVSVINSEILECLENAAKSLDKKVKVHLKVNAGLNRLGIPPSKLFNIARKAFSLDHVEVEGLYAQARDPKSAKESFNRVNELFVEMKSKGIAPKFLHFANSTTFIEHPETTSGGVRLGILLYGVLPPEQYALGNTSFSVKPAMTLTTKIVQLRSLPRGSKIGYRAKDGLKRDSLIATIPMGYSEGLDRRVSKTGFVMVKNVKVPFVGAISMNSSTIDVTDIPNVSIGDKVLLFGRQGKSKFDINELARSSGTISAELMMRFGRGISRQYKTVDNLQDKDTPTEIAETLNIKLDICETEKDLPEWVNVSDVIDFLLTQLKPFEDTVDVTRSAIDYALSTDLSGNGFVVIASRNQDIIGVVVSIRTETKGFIPENVLVYITIRKDLRNKEFGRMLMKEAVNYAEGDVKLHVRKNNPAVKFYRKLGFTDDYLEMRYEKLEDTNDR